MFESAAEMVMLGRGSFERSASSCGGAREEEAVRGWHLHGLVRSQAQLTLVILFELAIFVTRPGGGAAVSKGEGRRCERERSS